MHILREGVVMELVFVHLGPGKADHLPVNVKHIKKLFPESSITLIITEDGHRSLRNLQGINYYTYKRINNSETTFAQLEHNSNFREGFWIFSLERIFALEEWSAVKLTSNFLHIESDVLLMSDFPLSVIESLDVLAWTRFNDVRDVATFIYSPNHKEIAWVVEEIKKLIVTDRLITDMTSLSHISHRNVDRVKILPSTPSELKEGEHGLFDPAAYGMWLTGQDPRNRWGFLHKYVPLLDSDSKPENFSYIVKKEGRIEISDVKKSYSLYNLHIHSKRKVLFGQNWLTFLKWDAFHSQRRILSISFSPHAFLVIFIDAFKKHQGLAGLLKTFFRLTFKSANRK
jgi:hypothetical protein